MDIDFLKDFTFRTAGSYNWAQIKTTNFDDGRTANAQLKGGPYGRLIIRNDMLINGLIH